MKSRARCLVCGRFLVLARTGRPRQTCSDRCRKIAHRRFVAWAASAEPSGVRWEGSAASEASGPLPPLPTETPAETPTTGESVGGQVTQPEPHSEASPPHLASLGADVVGCQGSDVGGPRSGVALIRGRGRSMVWGGGVVGAAHPGTPSPTDSETARGCTLAVSVDFYVPRRLLDVRCRL